MRLGDFIRTELEKILASWDEFAGTVKHSGRALDPRELRDHAREILIAIADDIDEPQSAAQQVTKSRGLAQRDKLAGDSAAETHADTRIVSGFAVDAMLTEYRALRASVLRLWAASEGAHTGPEEVEQLTRFNEAVDQAITESVTRYVQQVERNTNLFMGMLGHDIRNPLGTIRLSAELLVRSGQLSDKAANPISNGARRIEAIIEQIVDFTRAQSKSLMPLSVQVGNLEHQFRSVIAESRVRHPNADLQFTATGDLEGRWDFGRLSQLLSNLLENALAYGARQKPVAVQLAGEPEHVRFSVHNFGKPIAAQDRETIFDPLVRGTGAEENRRSGGLGLGLYICREIVRAHQGRLSVRSEPIEGTTFSVELPRSRGLDEQRTPD